MMLILVAAVAACTFHVDSIGARAVADLGVPPLDSADAAPAFDLMSADLQAPPLRDFALSPPDLATAPDLCVVPVLNFNVVMPTPTTTDLTQEGKLDWAHWGLSGTSPFDHKANVTSVIANFSPIGVMNSSVAQYGNGHVAYSWSDGAPDVSAKMSSTGVYVLGMGHGFHIEVQADTTTRHARFYVGGFRSAGQAQLRLSDGSAGPETDVSCMGTGGSYNCVYDVVYRAASEGQNLQFDWTQADNGNNVSLQSVTVLDP